MVSSMVVYFRKLQQKASRMFGTVVVAKRLAWSGLVKRANRLHLEFCAEEGKESDGVEKQEKQSRIFKRGYTSTGAYPVTIGHT